VSSPSGVPGRAPAAISFACILGWEIAASGNEFPSWSPWPYFYMGVSDTFRSGPLLDGPYRRQKWSGPDPRSGWKSTPLSIHKNEINLTVNTCCTELETAARHCLMHCAAAGQDFPYTSHGNDCINKLDWF